MFGCTNPILFANNSTGHGYQFARLNVKVDNIKKLYEEVCLSAILALLANRENFLFAI
jgi:hypothetical protein